MSKRFKTLLLLALPASGKSELIQFLKHLDEEELARLRLYPIVALDDYPYVHLMRRIDEELAKQGCNPFFFANPRGRFNDQLEWLTLIQLLNEDYSTLITGETLYTYNQHTAGRVMLERIGRAQAKVFRCPNLLHSFTGITPESDPVFQQIQQYMAQAAQAINAEAFELLEGRRQLEREAPDCFTAVIEFSRGCPKVVFGPAGLQTQYPLGYQHSLSQLSSDILRQTAVLYLKVTPEQSRQKNADRTLPDDPGSILFHGVPRAVMELDYGKDDFEDLCQYHGRPRQLGPLYPLHSPGRKFFLPTAMFNNSQHDYTTPFRDKPDQWSKEAVHDMMQTLAMSMNELYEAYSQSDTTH